MSPVLRRGLAELPIANDGDELRFCSTCAFSDACRSQGYDKAALMDLHVLVQHVGPIHKNNHIFHKNNKFNTITTQTTTITLNSSPSQKI